ncbi:hypothetical protein [Cryobacterium tepidiphilum]|uniref:hypothetical protein n=1 Tax=Cryobacterium tepidiphilum TaxID=2486026 RepID=UPI0013149BA1|nr:hypothetical protein [Cryobacterium tepidiphilum]
MNKQSIGRRIARFLLRLIAAATTTRVEVTDAAHPPCMEPVQHSMGVNWIR